MPSSIRFEIFAQAMPNQVWSATPDGQLDWFNEQVFTYSALQYEDLAGGKWAQMVHPEDLSLAAGNWAKALSDGSLYQMEFRLRRHDGIYRWHLARAVAIKDQDGNITRWVGTNTDIEDHKAAERRLQLLSGELEHRIKNTMAVIGAIVRQTFRRATSKKEAEEVLMGRILALGKAHDALVQSSWEEASILIVVENALVSHDSGDGYFNFSGPDVTLKAKRALALAMALHELATNAAKYGSRSVPNGKVNIRWDVEGIGDSERLHFSWQESGGPPVLPPSERGFGSRLIEATLTAEFDAKVAIDYLPGGLRCSFDAKLDG